MSFDGIFVRALTNELKPLLIGSRIDKVQQPDDKTIVLSLRQPGRTHRLLISTNPSTARFHITEKSRPNPEHPPLFCMVLRKHLEGSRLIDIKQQGYERIVHFIFEGYDELGEMTTRFLIGDFMGKHSNLTLINPHNNLIIDSIKHLGFSTNQYRQILPGLNYIAPPSHNKLSLDYFTDEEKLSNELLHMSPEKKLSKALLERIEGFGPQTAKELCIRAGIDEKTSLEYLGYYEYALLWQEIKKLGSELESSSLQPTLVLAENKPLAFAAFSLKQFIGLNQIVSDSLSKLIEDFIGKKEDNNIINQKRTDLEKTINKELERCHKKLNIQLETIAESSTAEKFKIWGELLTANLYLLKQGKEACVTNYYSENQEEITIALEPNLTPSENAQKYFKKYNKAKIAAQKANEQKQLTLEEINYLESVKLGIEKAINIKDFQEIRQELEEAGYLKFKPVKSKKEKKEAISPIAINIDDYQILVGKNNKQNDYLTLKLAKNKDTWLHVKDIPGSHVIIKNQTQHELPERILETAANLAAYFSKARHSAQVPVDYTLKKHVKKPAGAKPGMVIYENQRTIFITPDEEKVLKLLENSNTQ